MSAPHEIFEDISSISYTMGKDMDSENRVFIQILAQSYKVKYPKAEVLTA